MLGPLGRQEDPGAGDRAALPVTDLPCQLPNRLEPDVRDRGAFAVELDPVGDKRREPIVPDRYAVSGAGEQRRWSLKRTLRPCFQRPVFELEYRVVRDPRIRTRGDDLARQCARPLKPDLDRDIGQRLAGGGTDDSDQSPGSAQLENDVPSLGHLERQRVRRNFGPATVTDSGTMFPETHMNVATPLASVVTVSGSSHASGTVGKTGLRPVRLSDVVQGEALRSAGRPGRGL